jgi:hypothetical protein
MNEHGKSPIFCDWVTIVERHPEGVRERYPVTGCVESGGTLSEVTHSSYRSSNGAYNGIVHQIVTGRASFAGVEPNLPVDPVDVAAVFAGCFVPMVSLYLVGFGIRKVLHLIEGRN